MLYIPEKVGFLGFTEVTDADMRQNFFLQDLPGILDPLLSCHARLGATGTDEVESYQLLLNHKCFIQ